jgi:hypothetical protein
VSAPTKVATLDTPPAPDTREEVEKKIDEAVNPGSSEEKPESVKREHTFQVDVESRMMGKRYVGTFTNQILTPKMELQVGTIRSQLLAGASSNVDMDTALLCEKIAHLRVSLAKKPKDFDPYECEDREILDAVYREVASHEARFWGRTPEED